MSDVIPEALFICTGNYYRSRFAQALFNHLMQERGAPWRAFSRGLWLQPGINPGTLSLHTKLELEKRGLPLELAGDKPRDLTVEDLQRARLTIALKEEEHRPLMHRNFPDYEDAITYWTVHDLDCAGPEEALPQIAAKVEVLVEAIQSGADGP